MQTFALVPMFVAHAAPQRVWPTGHIAMPVHIEPEHVWPAAHERPQAPQLLALLVVSTQVPPQLVCPAGHIIIELWQRPLVHVSGEQQSEAAVQVVPAP